MPEAKINRLINKYLDGTLTAGECAALNQLLESDPRNRKTFQELAGPSGRMPEADLQVSWNDLQRKILFREGLYNAAGKIHKSGRVRRLAGTILRYAAVLAIGILGTLTVRVALMNTGEDTTDDWIVAQTQPGQKAKVMLPDQSVVWLNSETTLSFPPDYLERRHREVKLDGEAYFEIEDQQRKDLTVVCEDYRVEVKGTRFNVMAYRDFNRTETTLVEGSVVVSKDDARVQLYPGQQLTWNGSRLIRTQGFVRQATLWKDNKFYFDQVSFRELVRRLERWYDVRITLLDASLNDEIYSGYFKNEETIWQVLDVLKMTTPISYERKEFREIVIDRK